MKVILLKDVDKVGKEGETLEVKEGYARNFLIPTGRAIKATKNSFAAIDELKKKKAQGRRKR
jgi:large subunit ribosomal protein L9